jgi:predicted anti-sigma-YlaC factor YlaD
MAAGELTCQELVELVTDYFEDALTPAERARFEEHLDGCAGCRAYLQQMRTTTRLVRASEGFEQRPEVAGLMRAFADWKRGRN